MGAADLLQQVLAAGFTLGVADGKLLVSPASMMTDGLRDALRACKPELIELLTGSPERQELAVRQSCADCKHFGQRGTCVEPVAAGLLTAEEGFGIVWPPAGHGAACPAFTSKIPTSAADGPHRLTGGEVGRWPASTNPTADPEPAAAASSKSTPSPEDDGPRAQEIAAAQREDADDQKALRLLLDSDAPLAAAPARITEQPAQIRILEERVRGLPNECGAAIIAGARDFRQAKTVGKPKLANVGQLATVAQRAAQSGASRNTQKLADFVAKVDPELAKQVAHGAVSLPAAAKAVAEKAGKKAGEKKAEKAKPAAAEPAAEKDDADLGSPDEIFRDMQRELDELHGLLKAADAHDQKAEALKWRRAYDAAVRGKSEAMDRAHSSVEREKATKKQLLRCGRAVGVEDEFKIVAAVEAIARSFKTMQVAT